MDELLSLYNVFFTVGLFSTVLYVLKLAVFIFVGGDTEVSADFDAMTETDVSFSFISTQTILAFLMGFGWSGLTALAQFGLSGVISFLIGLAVGFVFMFITAYLMHGIKKLNKHIKTDLNTLLNKSGKAYISMEPHKEGQIEIDLNERLSIIEATNISDEKINAFDPVKVVKVEDNKVYIIKGE